MILLQKQVLMEDRLGAAKDFAKKHLIFSNFEEFKSLLKDPIANKEEILSFNFIPYSGYPVSFLDALELCQQSTGNKIELDEVIADLSRHLLKL